jgi:glycosyltransferase involved in cell wall biosynthesis
MKYYTHNIAYNNTYTNTIEKIQTFNNKDAIITFIIPTINRDTLVRALQSLLNQTIQNWVAIIIFDGCEPTDTKLLDLLDNPKFLFFSIKKVGQFKLRDEVNNSAGYVRNVGMSLVLTPWIGFLDDDDCLCPSYTEKLLEEIELNKDVELILFRMINNKKIIPSLDTTKIIQTKCGISYSIKTKLFNEGFIFEQSAIEDFKLIKNIETSNKKIVISPHITYLVGNSNFIEYIFAPRIYINV